MDEDGLFTLDAPFEDLSSQSCDTQRNTNCTDGIHDGGMCVQKTFECKNQQEVDNETNF